MFKEKKILLVCPQHYDFPDVFITEFASLGAEVIYFPDIEKEFYFRLIRKIPAIRNSYINYMHRRLIELNKEYLFDYLLVIKGKIINENCLKTIKNDNPGIRLLLYQWDSLRNNDYQKLIHSFDITASFDYFDVRTNAQINYLPLFYTKEFEAWESTTDKRKIDLFFFGVFYEDRYRFLKNIEIFARQQHLNYYFKLYISFFSLLVVMLKTRKFYYKNLTMIPLSRKKISSIIKESRCVIDIHHQNQTGLTMRTIEALGAGCKLFTTNPNIREESFFSNSVIKVITRNEKSLDIGFIRSDYVPIRFSDFSIKNFIIKLFNFDNQSLSLK